MSTKLKVIYCAGPLFNPREREDMGQIARELESSGFRVFLPHRDGLELSKLSCILSDKGVSSEEANRLLSRAIFHIDTYHVMACDGLLLNVNGRVPDEGAMVEAGIAWALEKPVVIYKNDSRTLLMGQDNPLVSGLAGFRITDTAGGVVHEFRRAFKSGHRPMKKPLRDWLLARQQQGATLYASYQRSNGLSEEIDSFINVLTAHQEGEIELTKGEERESARGGNIHSPTRNTKHQ